MMDVVDDVKETGEGLPLREILDFDMDHVTLVVDKWPVYDATSVEVRADEAELRSFCNAQQVTNVRSTFDNARYRECMVRAVNGIFHKRLEAVREKKREYKRDGNGRFSSGGKSLTDESDDDKIKISATGANVFRKGFVNKQKLMNH